MRIENKLICLRLNSAWSPIGYCTVKDAIVSLNSRGYGEDQAPACAMNIEYIQTGENEWDFKNPQILGPTKWEDWINLPVRPYDLVIHTAKMAIRVPTVIIAVNFSKMPKRHFKPSNSGIWERDRGICQVTGKRLTKENGNVDHLISRKRWKDLKLPGTPDTWENMALMSKDINTQKGEKTLDECGLKLIRKPRAPLALPLSATIHEARHASWEPFLIKNQ